MKRSKHSLSHYKLLTCDPGELVPIGLVEALPGDSIQHATSALVRTSPLLSPVMHPFQVKIHHWFVPYRLIWDDWENFITGGEDGLDNSTFPTIDVSSAAVGSLADYLGVPTGVTSLSVSALPFRAYAMIYNSHYRDQDLQTALTIDTTDGVDTTTSTALKSVNWEYDYYTGAKTSTQKGTEVSLPLGTEAPVITNGANPNLIGSTSSNQTRITYNSSIGFTNFDSTPNNGELLEFHDESGLKTDLSNATAATINQLREAIALQKYAENRSRYGSRYSEYLKYLGVMPQDSRLDRPEYLAGGKQTIQFSAARS